MSRDNHASRIRQRGAHIAADVRGIGNELKEATSEKLHSMKDAVSDKFTALKDGAATLGRNTRTAVNGAVTKSPWKSMLAAAGLGAGAGLFAGWYFSRKQV